MRTVVAAVVVQDGLVLAARRHSPVQLAGKWEFPGGKVEPGESPEVALRREIAEELGLDVVVGDEIVGPLDRTWPINDRLHLRAYWCRIEDGRAPSPGDTHDEVRWLTGPELVGLDWLPADVPLAQAVAARVVV